MLLVLNLSSSNLIPEHVGNLPAQIGFLSHNKVTYLSGFFLVCDGKNVLLGLCDFDPPLTRFSVLCGRAAQDVGNLPARNAFLGHHFFTS